MPWRMQGLLIALNGMSAMVGEGRMARWDCTGILQFYLGIRWRGLGETGEQYCVGGGFLICMVRVVRFDSFRNQ